MPLETIAPLAVAAAVTLAAVTSAHADTAASGGQVVIPESSVEKPGDVGKRGHTNIEIFVPRPGLTPPSPGVGPGANPQATGAGGGRGAAGSQKP
jgi:hypothetical protein